jgi:YD repeat-containing protein
MWGYNQTLPVVKATNLSEEELLSAINKALPSNYQNLNFFLIDLNKNIEKSAGSVLWAAFNDKLRKELPDAFIETYTYIPLKGMSSTTDSRGQSVYYEYDNLGRLIEVRDTDGNLVSENKYHFKN